MQEPRQTHPERKGLWGQGYCCYQPVLVSFSITINLKVITDPVFRTDTPAELELVKAEALAFGADAAVVSNHWAKGGEGARALAEAMIDVCESSEPDFKFTYELELPIAEKINAIATNVYGADGIELSELAAKQIATYEAQGYGNLPSKLALVVQSACKIANGLVFGSQFAWLRPRYAS